MDDKLYIGLTEDLTSAGIIDHSDAAELQSRIGNNDIFGENLLKILYFFFENKVVTRPKNGGFFFSINTLENYDPAAIKEDTTPYIRFLDILLHYNIISETIYAKLGTFPLPGNKHTYLGLLYLAVELQSFYQNFTVEKQNQFAATLAGTNEFGRDGMLDHRKKKALQKAINAGQLHTYLDFFKYCFCCKLVDLTKYRAKQQKLLKTIKDIINDLCYESFTIADISVKESVFNGEPTHHNRIFDLRIDLGFRAYDFKYTFSVGGKENPDLSNMHLLENLLVSINKILADFACSYRFTSVTCTLNAQLFPGSRTTYAVCRVDEVNKKIFESDELNNRSLFARPLHILFGPPLSYTHIQYALYHFENCGIFAHLSNAQLNTAKQDLYHKTYEHIADLLVMIPGTIAIVNQDIPSGSKPYLNFLTMLNEISHGVLNFTEINDETPAEFEYETEAKFKISFKCNNEYHELECNLSYKNFDYGIVHYVVNDIIRKRFASYHLTQMIGGTYGTDYFIFMTTAQSEYLEKMKLRAAIDRF
jgi:hypothetical protein